MELLSNKILETEDEIRRLFSQIRIMEEANMRRGAELARQTLRLKSATGNRKPAIAAGAS